MTTTNTTNNTNKNEVYKIVTDQIIAQLEKGNIPWHKPWYAGSIGSNQNAISHKPYRGINAFLLACSPYTSRQWVTFKQVQELGGTVRKGERGMIVTFYKTLQYKNTKLTPAGETEEELKNIPLLRYYRVWNLEQCEGGKVEAMLEKEKEALATNTPTKEHDPIERAEEIQLAMRNRPTITFTEAGQDRAYYRPSTDEICVPNKKFFDHVEEFYSTLFHEMGHSTGHESRCNRDMSGMFGDHSYSQEELIAEMTACLLCNEAGILQHTLENSGAYIKGWLSKLRNDPKCVVIAASKAQRATDYILNRHVDSEDAYYKPEMKKHNEPKPEAIAAKAPATIKHTSRKVEVLSLI